METLLNPYIAGVPVTEKSMFFGRADAFKWIEQSLAGKFVTPVLVIHGQRRVGKTSVLKQIPNWLSKRYLQIFIDMHGRTQVTLDRFLWWLARDIARAIRQESGIDLPIPEQKAFSDDPDYFHLIFLPTIQRKIEDRIILFTFDEFDSLEQPDVREKLAKYLISYLRELFGVPNIAFIFSIGSSGHKLENMRDSYTEFFKTALYKKITFLSPEDCYQLITKPVEGILNFAPESVKRIFQITSGQPYFTQLICHELFSHCQKTGDLEISLEDVENILDDVVERGTVNLKFTWDDAQHLERWVMTCLSSAQGDVTTQQLADLLKQHQVRFSKEDLNSTLLRMQERDILTKDNHFVIHLLRIWLSKNRPPEKAREELEEINPILNRFIEIAEEFFSKQDLDRSLENYDKALSIDPENLRALAGKTKLLLQKEDFHSAAQLSEKILKIDEDDVVAQSSICQAYLNLGNLARKNSNHQEAEHYYHRVLEINSAHAEAHQLLADLHLELANTAFRNNQEHIGFTNLRLALELTPEDTVLKRRVEEFRQEKLPWMMRRLIVQAENEQKSNHWDAAQTILETARSLDPDDEVIHQAIQALTKNRRNYRIKTLPLKARFYEKNERWSEALDCWQKTLEEDPEEKDVVQQAISRAKAQKELSEQYHQALVMFKHGDYSAAGQLLLQILNQNELYKDAAQLFAKTIRKRQNHAGLTTDTVFQKIKRTFTPGNEKK